MDTLGRQEKDSLRWLYYSTRDMIGGMDPADFSEYEKWLDEAKELLKKLGVRV